MVTAFTPTPTGFTATFSKPVNPADIFLFNSNQNTTADVTLVGNSGVNIIHGTLLFDSTNQIITFKATQSYLQVKNSLGHTLDPSFTSVVLPDATYTVTLVSGSGNLGFLDLNSVGLDGQNNGGTGNYTTTFTTHFQANANPTIAIPDFARGPDSNTPIQVPTFSAGIPITVFDAANVTGVNFTMTYNANLLGSLGALGGAGSDATDQNNSTLIQVSNVVTNGVGVATYQYADATAISATPDAPLILGDVTAVVPSAPGAAALSMYQAKEQLALAITGMTYSSTGFNAVNAAITSATHGGSTVTITTTAPNNLIAGAGVAISGVADNLYNGTFAVANIISPTKFQYIDNNDLVTFTATGTANFSYSGLAAAAPFSYTLGTTTASSFATYLATIPGLSTITAANVTGNNGGPFTVTYPFGVAGGNVLTVPNSNTAGAAITGGLATSSGGSVNFTQGTSFAASNGIHVNAYFGDVNGDKVIDGLDKLAANNIATGNASGFSAYVQMDPVIIGDVAGDNSVDAGDVSTLDAYVAQLQPLQIPVPPTQLPVNNPNFIPPGNIHSPNAADPTLSLALGENLANGEPTGVSPRVISVLLDHPDPTGSTGLTEATLALTYDPSLLSVASSDITLGSLPSLGTGWQLTSKVDAATGQIGIQLFSLTPITAAQAGSLVNISFHVLPGEPTGVSPRVISSTPVQLVNTVTVNGQPITTVLADTQSAMVLSPGMDQVSVETGLGTVPATTTVWPGVSNPEVLAETGGLTPRRSPLEDIPGQPALVSSEPEEGMPFAVVSNGTVPGESSAPHAVPANLIVTGMLAFQPNLATAVAVQPAGQTLPIGNTPLGIALPSSNNPQQPADRFFLSSRPWNRYSGRPHFNLGRPAARLVGCPESILHASGNAPTADPYADTLYHEAGNQLSRCGSNRRIG